jgi:CBS domain-containing protein
MKVSDLMTRHVEFVEADATAQDAAALMGELDVSALPLGSAQDLRGIITDRDLLYRVVAEGKDPRSTRVRDVATKLVFTCRADDALTAAMDLMASHNIRRLPVTEDERVVGWLTLSDISRRLLVDSEVVQSGLKDLTEGLSISGATESDHQPPNQVDPQSHAKVDQLADREAGAGSQLAER